MIKRILRELYMLPRGEQRAMVLLSMLLLFSIMIRIWVQAMPGREPAGMDDFIKESRAIMAAIKHADSLSRSTAAPSPITRHQSPVTSHQSPITIHQPPVTIHQPPITLNTADSVQLLPLPGIGPVFAGRIIKYRKLLGGFVRFDQLYEVYGLKEETIQAIKGQIYIDTLKIRKMDINHATFGELLKHPYLEMEHVKALVNYRDFAGRVDSIHELYDNHLIPDSTLQRVLPYLQIDR